MLSSGEIKQHFLENRENTKYLEEFLFDLRSNHLDEAVNVAISLLSDSSEEVRAYAMWIVEMLKPSDPQIVPELLSATQDSNRYVRSHAIVYLAGIGLTDLTSEVIAVLEDDRVDISTRCRAAIILGRQGELRTVYALKKCLNDENPDIVWHAIFSLSLSNADYIESLDVLQQLKKIKENDGRRTKVGLSLAAEAAKFIRSM